jgi:hypothetical protein
MHCCPKCGYPCNCCSDCEECEDEPLPKVWCIHCENEENTFAELMEAYQKAYATLKTLPAGSFSFLRQIRLCNRIKVKMIVYRVL